MNIELLESVLKKHQAETTSQKAFDLLRRLEQAPPGITSEWKARIKEVASAAYEMSEALK